MHEDQVNKELENFEKAAKSEGGLKVLIEFPTGKPLSEEGIGEIDIGKPQYIKKDKKKATKITLKNARRKTS